MPSGIQKIVFHADKAPTKELVRRFNITTTDEVEIAVFEDQYQPRQQQGSRAKNAETHLCYDALQYPIIF